MKTSRSYMFLFILSVLILAMPACLQKGQEVKTEIAQGTSKSGELISYELLRTLTLEDIEAIRTISLNAFLSTASLTAQEYQDQLEKPKYPVKLYKVTYHSVIPEKDNKPVVASGIIAIPDVADAALPLISYQHGTIFERSWAPTAFDNSVETQLMVSQFASQGYMLIAADYFGFGDATDLPNSYFVRYSTEQACLDMYKASLQVIEKEKKSVTNFFVNGWSQGGFSAMLFLRRLEQENIYVKAAFSAAAPVDLALFVTRGVLKPRPIDAAFLPAALCNMIHSYSFYNSYDDLPQRYIKPEYQQHASDLYNFKISFEEFMVKVPGGMSEVFTADFFADARANRTGLWRSLYEAEAYRWQSVTPYRAYGGGQDEVVPEDVALLAAYFQQAIGKENGEAFSAGPKADHRNTFVYSIIKAKPWIDSFN